MEAGTILTRSASICSVDDSIAVAGTRLKEKGGIILLVTNWEGTLIGTVAARDLQRNTLDSDRSVTNIMSGDPHTCHYMDNLTDAEGIMRENHLEHIPVVNEYYQPIGILSLAEVQRSIREIEQTICHQHWLVRTMLAIFRFRSAGSDPATASI